MTLPSWNNEWEKSDPLRGRQGWVRHHYAAAGVLAAVVVGVILAGSPAIVRTRQKEDELNRLHKEMREAFLSEHELRVR